MLSILTQEPGYKIGVKRGIEANLQVQDGPCGRERDYTNCFIIKLSHDWTDILETEPESSL